MSTHGLTSQDIEMAVATHFNWRQNLIVPNVSWGLFSNGMEADILILRPSGFCVEVEIKISAADIKRDLNKGHNHSSKLLRQTWFAVPSELKSDPNIPIRFGVISVFTDNRGHRYCETFRAASVNKSAIKLPPEKREKLFQLASMRMWHLKQIQLMRRNDRSKIKAMNGTP